MKVTLSDYSELKSAIIKVVNDTHITRQDYSSDTRFYFDLFHAANKITGFKFYHTLYSYLNDSNIETAIRNIWKEIETKAI